MPVALTLTPVAVRSGLFPGASTFPGPTVYPGGPLALAAVATGSLTLTAVT